MSSGEHVAPVAEGEPPAKKTKMDHAATAGDAKATAQTEARPPAESNEPTVEQDAIMADGAASSAAQPPPIPASVADLVSSASALESASSTAGLAPFPSADWSYAGKRIMAPMVRIGTLPMRRLAVAYGADMVYSEELVAKKLRTCVRLERRDAHGDTYVDFVPQLHKQGAAKPATPSTETDGAIGSADSKAAPSPQSHNSNFKPEHPALTTYPGEKLVVQLGASNANDALAAAKVVEKDARAIDLNCGCPKHFSLQGGMGAALLSKQDTLVDILTTLRRNIQLPITCKIRLLASPVDTLALVKKIEACGVSAIAVHARRIEDRPRHRALREQIQAIAQHIRIPLLYNGDVFYAQDIPRILRETGASSVMIARGAMWNASIFKTDGVMLPLVRVIGDFLALAKRLAHHVGNTKYCVMEMLKGQVGASQLFRDVTRAKDIAAIETAMATFADQEPTLTRGGLEYVVPVVLEERPASAGRGGPNESSAALPVDVQVEGAPAAAAAAAASSSAQPGRQMSKKERKYQAKQTRKNREGRKADEEAAAAEAEKSAPAEAAPAEILH